MNEPFVFSDLCWKCRVPMAMFSALQVKLCKNRECSEYAKQVRMPSEVSK